MMTLIMAAIAEEQNYPQPKPRKPNRLKESENETPFEKQSGVVKMVQDYNDIKKGISKKGVRKQNLIIKKVENWIKKGFIKL